MDVALIGGLATGIRGLGLAVARLGDGRRVTTAAVALVMVAVALVALVQAAAIWGMR